MGEADKIYRDLQIHLDEQTIGFPATESGSDIRLLMSLFNREQAEATLYVTYKAEPVEVIYERTNKKDLSIEELKHNLDSTARRGMIGKTQKDGKDHYFTIPYVVGMAEAAATNPTPEFISANQEWIEESRFWDIFIRTKIPQMRTIPVEESIVTEHNVGTYDEIRKIVENSDGPFAAFGCVCRDSAAARGEPCQKTSRKDTCFAMGAEIKKAIDEGAVRGLSKEEALEVLRKNEEDGLVLQPANAINPNFICSCCGDCCGILRLHKAVPNPSSFWSSNFFAEVDSDLCSGCETCVEQCQVEAMKMDEEKGVSYVNLDRCIGCGNCVPTCPSEAIQLVKKENEQIPPKNYTEMIEVIMEAKNQSRS
ncbi:MAG: 4Fe-4S binding protein [Promethearchaeota archaeon]